MNKVLSIVQQQQQEQQEFRQEVLQEVQQLRQEQQEFRQEVRQEVQQLRQEVQQLRQEQQRQGRVAAGTAEAAARVFLVAEVLLGFPPRTMVRTGMVCGCGRAGGGRVANCGRGVGSLFDKLALQGIGTPQLAAHARICLACSGAAVPERQLMPRRLPGCACAVAELAAAAGEPAAEAALLEVVAQGHRGYDALEHLLLQKIQVRPAHGTRLKLAHAHQLWMHVHGVRKWPLTCCLWHARHAAGCRRLSRG